MAYFREVATSAAFMAATRSSTYRPLRAALDTPLVMLRVAPGEKAAP
jgi:hypothetical protein